MSSMYTAEFGPNVEQILCQGSRVIRGKVPSQVRAELRAAVKANVLGRLPKDGLKPEVFFNPNNKMSAVERQKREAEYSISCIAKVMARPEDYSLARQALEDKHFG
ncbi:hypothetical protein GCM10011491_30440 [Brucella endophytica]|uniref:Uncharacterized protein n=1 Tax=Brucella endophytica TaxID=1963359 RepID=A0A916SK05_9HYPH|nr:hypothetical protein [Brucella endophytica]GGB00089.1 hypothetical protein GCM10011491_30440 [Brucella endophytica]